MKKTIRLTESDLTRLVRRVIKEQQPSNLSVGDRVKQICDSCRGISGGNFSDELIMQIAKDLGSCNVDEARVIKFIKNATTKQDFCKIVNDVNTKSKQFTGSSFNFYDKLMGALNAEEILAIWNHIRALK